MDKLTIDQVRDLLDRSLQWLQADNNAPTLQQELIDAINHIDSNHIVTYYRSKKPM